MRKYKVTLEKEEREELERYSAERKPQVSEGAECAGPSQLRPGAVPGRGR